MIVVESAGAVRVAWRLAVISRLTVGKSAGESQGR